MRNNNYFKLAIAFLAFLALSGCGNGGSSGSSVSDDMGTEDTGTDGIEEPDATNFTGRWTGVLYQAFDAEDDPYGASFNYELELQRAGDIYTGTSRVTSLDKEDNIISFSVTASVDQGILKIVEQTLQSDASPTSATLTPPGSGRSVQCLSRLDLTASGNLLVGAREAPRCPFGSIYLSRIGVGEAPQRAWYESLPACPCQLSDVVPEPTAEFALTADDLLTADNLSTVVKLLPVEDSSGNPGSWFWLPNLPSEIEGIPVSDPPFWPQLNDNHPGAVSEIRWTPDNGGPGQQCTYGFSGELITGGLAAGTPDQVSPGRGAEIPLAVAGHLRADVLPFSDLSCEQYLEAYPPNNANSCLTRVVTPVPSDASNLSCKETVKVLIDPDGESAGESSIPPVLVQPLVPVPASYTDPHLVTIDGLGYSFQAVGEFVLARSALPGLEIQARQTQYGGPNSPVSVNSGFAFDVNGDTVSVVPSPAGVLTIYVEDEPQTPAGEFDLPEGGRVVTESATTQILWPDGSIAVITDRSRFLNLALALDDQHAGLVSGLLGNFDTNTQNDLLTSEGRDITTTPEANELYGEFADGWRVTDDTSLFTYFDGATTATFTNRLLPGQVVSADTLDDTVRENAATACRDAGITNDALLQNCIVDIGVSGDTEFATALNAIQQELAFDIEPAVVQGEISVPTLACDGQSALADYNAQYSGTFTNPDAGLVWDAALQLGQCSSDVVGLMTIEAGSSFQNRRLLGTLDQGQITLDAGFPVAYDSLNPCRGMQITLAGSGSGLAGFWTASNCPQGGEINLPGMTPTGSLLQAEIDELTGTWTGPVDQPGSSTEYSAMLTFTQTEEGLLEGVTNYPELACDTTLVFLGEEGGYLTFRETVVTKITACVNQGTVSVRLDSSDTLEWLYRMPGATDVTARAQLSRQ